MATMFPGFPISVSVKTASYAIPSDKKARVVVEVDGGGIFTINGVNAVTSAAFVNVAQGTANNTTPINYTVPSGFKFTFAVAGSGTTANTITVNGLSGAQFDYTAGRSSTYIAGAKIGPGGTVNVPGTSSAVKALGGLAEPSNATNRQAVFYLPGGTTISGTGNWRAVVEEYV
jgi:hypothetical protein